MSSDKIELEDCAPAEIENKAPFTTLLCQLSVSTVYSGLPDASVAFGLQWSTALPGQDPVIDTQNRLREVRACHRFKGWKNGKMPFPDIWREGDPGGAEWELRKSAAPSKERCCLRTRAADGVIGGWLRLRPHLAFGRADSEPPHPVCGPTSCHAGKELFCPFTRPRPILLSSDLSNPPPHLSGRLSPECQRIYMPSENQPSGVGVRREYTRTHHTAAQARIRATDEGILCVCSEPCIR
jgi:hypothetical protein